METDLEAKVKAALSVNAIERCQYKPFCTHGNGQSSHGHTYMQTMQGPSLENVSPLDRCSLQVAGSSHYKCCCLIR